MTLGEELETVRMYLDIEQTRFADRLEVRIQADPEALEARIPCLILLPLAENAVTHGIARLTRPGGSSWTRGRRTDACRSSSATTVRSCPPAASSPAEGLGLRNTRLRLEQLCGPTARLDFAWAPEGGARVTLDLPRDFAPGLKCRPAPSATAEMPSANIAIR